MMYERDYNNDMYYSHKHGVEEGMEKGRAEGKAEEKISAARNLKKLGVSIETISQALGLTPEQIEEL